MMKNNEQKPDFLFDKVNYTFLFIGIAVIALGFILMCGGGSDDPKVFHGSKFESNISKSCDAVVYSVTG